MRPATLLLPIFFLASRLHGRSSGHPVYGSELADFKSLLERLEDKLEPGAGDAGLERDFNEPDDELAEEALPVDAPWDGEYPRPPSEGGFRRSDRWPSARVSTAARNRLGALLSAPRRLSSCFGQRLDRIGSSSGLGCKRSRLRRCRASSNRCSIPATGQYVVGEGNSLACPDNNLVKSVRPGPIRTPELNLCPTTANASTTKTCCTFPGTA